jgi:dTDP-4-amino-4,6-dideoxygalactose transaminase
MDPNLVERAITPKTKAILPVHLYGQPANMDALMDISRRRGIPLIEDVAQAHGAEYNGRRVGTFGQSGCFSFYPGKNLGAYGEGGAVVTNDDAIAGRLRALRDHAQEKRYHHSEIGFNYRMDGFQGAVLGVKLRHLDRWTQARRDLAARYQQKLSDLPLQLPTEAIGRRHVWHLYVALHTDREQLRAALETRGIQTGLHYPVPLHLQKAYAHLGYRAGKFPVTERIANQCVTLPLFPEMTEMQQDAVIEALTEILGVG